MVVEGGVKTLILGKEDEEEGLFRQSLGLITTTPMVRRNEEEEEKRERRFD